LNVLASGFFKFSPDPKFKKIIKYVIEKSSTLSKISDQETFRKGCLDLAKYLIINKSPPVYYRDLKDMWEGAIKNWVKSHYEKLNIHGGCPVVMDENDMKILELKYEEEDFCKKRDTYLNEIKQLKRKHLRKCNDDYLRKCSEYKVWINLKKTYFDNNRSLIQNCYNKQKPSGKSIRKKGPELSCDIMNQEIFNEPTDCLLSSSVVSCETSTKNKQEIEIRRTEVTNESPSMPHVKKEENTQIAQEVQPAESEAIIQEEKPRKFQELSQLPPQEQTELPLQKPRETITNKTAVIQTENVPTSGGHTNFESPHNSTPQGTTSYTQANKDLMTLTER
ncbi:PIR Superfamily Protein, partial [Plasmodium malariae]